MVLLAVDVRYSQGISRRMRRMNAIAAFAHCVANILAASDKTQELLATVAKRYVL
jgi:hypothetical protein